MRKTEGINVKAPLNTNLRKYSIAALLIVTGVFCFGYYRVAENNRCDSWRNLRWFDLLSDELKKNPKNYEKYMNTVGRTKFTEIPKTWAGATSVFPYMVKKASESGLIDPNTNIDEIVNKVQMESIQYQGCPR